MSRSITLIGCLILAYSSARADQPSPNRPTLMDGDRVIWLGGTLIEREQVAGYWETLLTASYPDCRLVFRNLGWSGDTVWGESRGMFDPPEQGYARMIELVQSQHPTLIVLAYGDNEAFAGAAGMERFVAQYRKLVADVTTPEVRFAFLLPVRMVESATPTADIARSFDDSVAQYGQAIRALAAETNSAVIDLSRASPEEARLKKCPLTSDGMHFTACGYWALANRLRDQFDVSRPDVSLPIPPDPYPPLSTTASSDRLERLRTAIVEKNALFFHRWRPENFTYLFGFRKYEQGNNAVEIPQFDPLIEQKEADILKLQRTAE